MKAPVKISLGGKQIRVEYVDALPDGDSGEAVSIDNLIRVSKAAHRSAEDVRSTLLHELLHIALGVTGHSEAFRPGQEEAVVYGLENMLAPLLVFNPKAKITYREVEFPWE